MYQQWLVETQDLNPWDLLKWSLRAGLGDGHPVLAPSARSVSAMCERCGMDPDSPVGPLPPLRRTACVGDLAFCTLLAGGEDVHLPVVTGSIRALEDPVLNALAALTTTGSAALAIIVNGPILESAGFGRGGNCLGPSSRSNAAVGRAVAMATRGVCGATAGRVDMATLGQPAKYGLCFGEDEKASPFTPLHVERGCSKDLSAVTVVFISGTAEVVDVDATDGSAILDRIALAMWGQSLTSAGAGSFEPVVVVSPEWATVLARAGLSKSDVKSELVRRSTERCDQGDGAQLRAGSVAWQGPHDALLVVAGGVGVKHAVLPSWDTSRAVTVSLESRR